MRFGHSPNDLSHIAPFSRNISYTGTLSKITPYGRVLCSTWRGYKYPGPFKVTTSSRDFAQPRISKILPLQTWVCKAKTSDIRATLSEIAHSVIPIFDIWNKTGFSYWLRQGNVVKWHVRLGGVGQSPATQRRLNEDNAFSRAACRTSVRPVAGVFHQAACGSWRPALDHRHRLVRFGHRLGHHLHPQEEEDKVWVGSNGDCPRLVAFNSNVAGRGLLHFWKVRFLQSSS